MIIAGLEKFTLLDYPGKISAVLFTYGCDMRCPYCHNPELVTAKITQSHRYSDEDILGFLKRRVGQLDAVVITGGEPTIHRDLEELMEKINQLGFLVKLDSNGGSPKRISEILPLGIVSYWAMDVKYSGDLYQSGMNGGRKIDEKSVRESIKLIMDSGVDYEFRTTVVRGIHEEESMHQIGEMIKGGGDYYIQNFRAGKTIDPTLNNTNSFTEAELLRFKSIMEQYVERVVIR